MNKWHGMAAGLLSVLLLAWAGCAEAQNEAPTESDAVKHLTDAAQFAEWTASGSVVVDFYADWCGPCRRMSPALSAFASEQEGKVLVVKVNVDKYPDLSQQYKVSSIPYLVLFKDGKVSDTRVGMQSLEQLRSWLAPE
ncbi:MAG: thioredoxin [Kiritimatiellae bacterium]|nr:thioredoxin [Kiritimatiellia bacterium]